MVAQKIQILSKRTVRGSALVNLSDAKQGFTVPRGKQRCMEIALCNFCKFFYVFIVFVFTTNLNLSTRHDFFYSIQFEKLSLRNRWVIQKIILIQVKLSLTTTIKRGSRGPVSDKPVPDRWLCFCPNYLSICWTSLVAFGQFTFQKLVTNQLFGLDICAVPEDTFYPQEDYEQVNFYEKSSLYSIGWSFKNWKNAFFLQLAKNCNISTKVWQNLLFLSTFPTSLRCYAKGNWKSRVCAWSKLWIYRFLKKQRYKVLANFDESCEQICNSKAFVDIATAGRHLGLSTIYIKHNLFHQSKLRGDVELQNTHIVIFKCIRDVMQVLTLSTQLGLGSELNDWCQDATSVHFGHLLIDFLPRTGDRLRYCTNTGSFPSEFRIPDRLKQSKNLDDKHTKFLYSPSDPIILQQK